MIRERYPDYDPLRAMIEMANEPDADPGLRFAAHKEVAGYIYPKRKAVEVSGEDGEKLDVTIHLVPHGEP
jgi:hypothetical protein